MTATDELRRMLDERGVEWGNVRNDGSESNFFTEWQFDGIDGRATATEWSAGNNLSMAIYRWGLTPEQAIEATLGPAVPPPPAPDQPPYDVLLDILASEWGIDASWDGLRRFWCVELNDEGVRKRDELHSENAELRELVRAMATRLAYADRVVDGGVFDARLRREVAKLGVEVDG